MMNTGEKSRQSRIIAIVVAIFLVLGVVYAISRVTKQHEDNDQPAKTNIQRLPQGDDESK
jgi:flagellar basal body-associated protein FliL